jgi:DNA helicase II / ATP-dependent DNA helicase PcrA
MTTDIQENGHIMLKTLNNDEAQMDYIIDLVTKVEPKKNIAILYRNNISALTLIDELSRKGVAFHIKDTKMYVLKHWMLMDVLAFMTFSLDNSDLNVFEKIYYKMDAYLPKTLLNYLKLKLKPSELILDKLMEYPYLDEDQLLKLYEVKSKFEFLRGLRPIDAIEYILSEFNYNRYLKKYCKDNNVSENTTDELLFIIKAIAKHSATQVQFICRISELEKIVNEAMFNSNSTVMLSTIHGSKGLEFDQVVLMDLVEGKIPSNESVKRFEEEKDDSLLSEEARVFYVGITRAKSELTLITVDYKNNKRVSSSRFFDRVEEIIYPHEDITKNRKKTNVGQVLSSVDKNNVFPIGARVNHGHYGKGEVIASSSYEVSINFDSNIIKAFPASASNKYIFLDKSRNK